MKHHGVMESAIEYGETILHEGCIVSPEYYKKLPRPPESCHRCGINARCVELTQNTQGTRYICENCLSAGMPHFGAATCGSRICLLAACPHNPAHAQGATGISRQMRKYGQLSAVARNESAMISAGSARLRLSK